MTFHADLIVVGCGVAGLSAAVSAAEGGAKVILLERAPKEDRGLKAYGLMRGSRSSSRQYRRNPNEQSRFKSGQRNIIGDAATKGSTSWASIRH